MEQQPYRVLEVNLKSTCFNQNSEKKAKKRYAILSISPHVTLRTKLIQRSTLDRPTSQISTIVRPTFVPKTNVLANLVQALGGNLLHVPNTTTVTVWNERFVCLVPQSFTNDKNASITVSFYRTRKFLDDVLIGKSICKLGMLSVPEAEKAVRYDDDGDLGHLSDEDRLYFDFYDNVFEETGKEEETVKKEKLPAMKGREKVAVRKGSDVKGSLDVEMAVREGYISLLGDGQDFGMRYDEFMGQEGSFSVRMKKSSCICIAPPKVV